MDNSSNSFYNDYKERTENKNNGNYTTTKSLNTRPDEKVKQIQNQLNVMGYTDKFGNPLKEDGIAGSKTLYAFDKFDENVTNKYKNSLKFTNRKNHKTKTLLYYPRQDEQKMLDNSNAKLASSNYTAKLTSDQVKPDTFKYMPDILYDAWNKGEDNIWKAGAKVLDIYGYHLTSELLNLAASGKNNKYVASNGSYASELLKKDKGINKFINDIIWEYGTSKKIKNLIFQQYHI